MMLLNRVNNKGQQYRLREIFGLPEKIHVETGKKSMIFNASIHAMNDAWYKWMDGYFIQEAFHFLTPEEREFLITGITPDEWNEIFKDGDNGSNVQ